MSHFRTSLAAASIAFCAILPLRADILRAAELALGGNESDLVAGNVRYAEDWHRLPSASHQSPAIVFVSYDSSTQPANPTIFDPNVHPLPAIDSPGTVNLVVEPDDSGDTNHAPHVIESPPGNDVANLDVNPTPLDPAEAQRYGQFHDHPLVFNLLADERNFYRCASLEWLAAGLGISAILANTHADQGFRDFYSETFRPADRDLDFIKQFGNGAYVIPALAAIWALDFEIDSHTDDNPYGACVWLQEWSGRSMRGLIVGAVPVLSLQYLIGSARPNADTTSRWEPFKSTHGVSGHAFVCAVPFWTAAQMTDSWMVEGGLFTMGTMAGWSRIHTDTHYLSQVLLGWWLAGLSVSAVNHTQWETHQWYLTPTMDDGGVGISLIHLR